MPSWFPSSRLCSVRGLVGCASTPIRWARVDARTRTSLTQEIKDRFAKSAGETEDVEGDIRISPVLVGRDGRRHRRMEDSAALRRSISTIDHWERIDTYTEGNHLSQAHPAR